MAVFKKGQVVFSGMEEQEEGRHDGLIRKTKIMSIFFVHVTIRVWFSRLQKG